MADQLPDWADEWDGRKHCKRCKARLVVCHGFGGRHPRICSKSGWNQEKCNA